MTPNRPSSQPTAIVLSDDAAIPVLLIEHARALVQVQEDRFAAAQARATALLAVTGVLAGVGGGFLAGFEIRDYGLLMQLVLAVLAFVALGTLLWSAGLAVAVLKREAESDPPRKRGDEGQKSDSPRAPDLHEILQDGLPLLLDKRPEEAAESLLAILARQQGKIHRNCQEVHDGFRRAGRVLTVAVVCGLFLSFLVVFARAGDPQEVRLVEAGRIEPAPALARANLEGR